VSGRVRGKTALVTGAAQGIGRAAALALSGSEIKLDGGISAM
jgi:NAD(P)-dependent dehydrogenase (short-subunit alcohol dehydrogenase family)